MTSAVIVWTVVVFLGGWIVGLVEGKRIRDRVLLKAMRDMADGL